MTSGISLSSGSTSGGSPFAVRAGVLVLGAILASPAASTTADGAPQPAWADQAAQSQTSGGIPVSPPERAGAAIGVLRRFSGLTWEQLARLLGVSRRSLHFWASGKPMAPANEERLQRLIKVVRYIDRGSARTNREILLSPLDDGTIPFDLLASGQVERVAALLGAGGAKRIVVRRQSAEARAERAPRPPHEILDALHDPVHLSPTGGRAARSVKVRRGR